MEHSVDTTIQFSGLKPGNYKYQYTLDDSFFSDYKNEKILGGEVVFDVEFEKNERMMMLYFDYSGKVLTTCDRCLGEMEWPINGKQVLCVKISDNETSDNEDVVILPESAYKIDLAQWMYEYIVISLPIQCIHPDDKNGNSTCDPEMTKYLSDADERTETSDETASDPRWDALKKLKGND